MIQLSILSIAIQSSIGNSALFLVSILLVVFAFWSYRTTKPTVSKTLRYILAILRSIALISVLILAVQGSISWSFEKSIRPKIAMLIDESSSMTIEDREGIRSDVVDRIIKSDVINKLDEKFDIVPLGFSASLNEIASINDYSFTASVTNYESTFNNFIRLPQQNWAGIILVSDGCYNSGSSPIEITRQLDIPIVAIAVGDSIPPGDIVISNIMTPLGGYVAEKIPVDVTVRATGVVGQQATISISDEKGITISEKVISISKEWYEEKIRFDVTPEKAGLQNLKVEILPLENEIEVRNNSKQTILNIAERRRKILLLSGSPNQDIASIARILEDDKDSDTDIIIGSGKQSNLLRGNWNFISSIDNYDAVVIFLDAKYNRLSLSKLQAVYGSEVPLIIITGNGLVNSEIRRVSLPLLGETRKTGALVQSTPVPKRLHSIFYEKDLWFENSDIVPPLTISEYSGSKGETIASASINNSVRDVVKVMADDRRILVWYAGDLWKWELGRVGEDPGLNDYQQLWNRQLRWVTAKKSEEQITLSTDREIYNSGEEVQISVNITDDALHPVDDAVVTATISNENMQRSINFISISNGMYVAKYFPSTHGKFHIDASIEFSESVVKTKDFVVDDYNLELSDMRMRIDRLRSITKSTDGKVIFPDEVDQLTSLFSLEENVVEHNGLWRPIGKWLTLIILVLALALEWFIRTRKGMV